MSANFGSVGPLLRCKDATKGPGEPWICKKKVGGKRKNKASTKGGGALQVADKIPETCELILLTKYFGYPILAVS